MSDTVNKIILFYLCRLKLRQCVLTEIFKMLILKLQAEMWVDWVKFWDIKDLQDQPSYDYTCKVSFFGKVDFHL